MARFPNLAGLNTTFEDFGLQIANAIDVGDSLLVVGTATDGPLYQPVALQSLDDAIDKFGPLNQGTLVRGVFEAMNSINGTKDIRGMRIGTATQATLSLGENASGSAGTLTDHATQNADGTFITDAVTFTAKKEGEVANGFSVWLDTVASQQVVAVFNPYTNVTSKFTYSTDPNVDVAVHTVKELIDAVNADANLEKYLSASMKQLTAEYEVNLNTQINDVYASGVIITGASGTTAPGDVVILDLKMRLDPIIVGYSGTLPSGVHDVKTIHGDLLINVPTAGDKLVELQDAYLINRAPGISGVLGYEKLKAKGQPSVDLAQVPIGRNDTSYWDAGNKSIISIDGLTWNTPQYEQTVVNGLIGTSLDGTTSTFTRDAWVAHQANTVHVFQTLNNNKSEVPPTGYTISHTGAGSTGKLNFTFTSIPPQNAILTIDYRSSAASFNEVDTLAEATDSNTWTNIFVTGKTVNFGAAPPEDILVTYRYKNKFSIGGDVEISDAFNGKLQFGNASNSPKDAIEAGPDSESVDSGVNGNYTGAILGLKYTYQPEWAAITSSAKSLSGGGNGIVMSTLNLKESLDTAFDTLENYVVDIVILKDIYLDETITDYDVNTGLLSTISAGFAPMFCSFLDLHAEETGEIIGVMAVKPAATNALADVNDWFNKLTVIDTADATRAANIMAGLNCKWLQVTAAEPIFTNASLVQPYVGTAEALYGGLIQGLTPLGTLSSSSVRRFTTTNKPVSGILGTRYILSASQLDTLTQMRYITLRNRPAVGLVITDGVTAASEGSDYRRLSTLRIVKNAMKVVRDVTEPFIGEPNTAEQRDAMDTAVTKGLQAMVEAGVLRDFSFRVESTVAEQINGIVRVEMVLVPAFEMKRINVTVKLRATL